ncbi:unnamed protein product [Trifolium pratense]|uniref:Uncharacterized protein n=1 Tax=Trifolium pratense TaxID=57577 RepID=A0ACB0KA45_TRIPR|nr:unnamed protein product [Trifolium pratense]
MLRAIKYYGNITEVVIPTKRDVGGRRFGFARFSRVTDVRGFELKFDNIIIGRDNISVNLARYQRVEGERRFDRNQVRKEGRRSKRDEEQHDKEANERSLVGTLSFPCGVVGNETQSAEVGFLQHSLVSEGGGEGHRTGGVYSGGPRIVYLKLTKVGVIGNKDAKGKGITRIHPTPAKVRKHQYTIQYLNLKISNPDLSLFSFRANLTEDKASSCRFVSEFNGVTRNPPSQHRPSRKPTSSLSSAGEILCCSSLSSSDFRNCNRRFMEKYDQESGQKLW